MPTRNGNLQPAKRLRAREGSRSPGGAAAHCRRARTGALQPLALCPGLAGTSLGAKQDLLGTSIQLCQRAVQEQKKENTSAATDLSTILALISPLYATPPTSQEYSKSLWQLLSWRTNSRKEAKRFWKHHLVETWDLSEPFWIWVWAPDTSSTVIQGALPWQHESKQDAQSRQLPLYNSHVKSESY